MKKKLSVYAAAAIAIAAVILILPEKCLRLSLNGLTLWFSKMIPALFPFMVLSGIMIRMKLVDPCVKFLMPVLGRLFNIGSGCVYGMVIGFLCGFPMGAHTAAQLYENKMISKREASFLLAFCNNIGPVYFLSFALPMALPVSGMDSSWGIYLFGMYGLPFFYGLFLRYVFFRDITPCPYVGKQEDSPGLSLLGALDQSLEGALFNIARLGGYMVVFNLLFIFPILLAGILHLPGPAGHIFIGGLPSGDYRRYWPSGEKRTLSGIMRPALWRPLLHCSDCRHDPEYGSFYHGICHAQDDPDRNHRFLLPLSSKSIFFAIKKETKTMASKITERIAKRGSTESSLALTGSSTTTS